MKKLMSFQQHRLAAEKRACAAYNAEPEAEAAAYPDKIRTYQTGPKTPLGKMASSQNARKHGLCSTMLMLPDEDPEQYQILREGLLREYRPATMTEDLLVTEMCENSWRLRRVRNREAEVLHRGNTIDHPFLQVCHRYATAHDRAFHRALRTLRQIQKERLQNAATTQKEAPAHFVSQNAAQSRATTSAAVASSGNNALLPGYRPTPCNAPDSDAGFHATKKGNPLAAPAPVE